MPISYSTDRRRSLCVIANVDFFPTHCQASNALAFLLVVRIVPGFVYVIRMHYHGSTIHAFPSERMVLGSTEM